jgi:hypothetical protein
MKLDAQFNNAQTLGLQRAFVMNNPLEKQQIILSRPFR